MLGRLSLNDYFFLNSVYMCTFTYIYVHEYGCGFGSNEWVFVHVYGRQGKMSGVFLH